MTPGAESKTPFPDLVNHHPKAVLAGGWWLGCLTEATDLTERLKNRITEDHEG